MATYYVDNSDGRLPWQADHAYSVGDRCCCKIENSAGYVRCKVFECTQAGTSGSSEPAWNWSVLGGNTDDNSVKWATRNPTSWANSHPALFLMVNYDAGLLANGDTIKVHNAHNEDIGTADADIYISPRYGTLAAPLTIVCVDKNNSDALSSGAVCRNRRTIKQSYWGGVVVWVNMQIVLDGYFQVMNDSSLNWNMLCVGTPVTVLKLNSASSRIILDLATPASNQIHSLTLINSNIELTDSGNYFDLKQASFEWYGGTLVAASGVSRIFRLVSGSYSPNCRIYVEDVDLSAIGANKLIDGSNHAGFPVDITFSRCKIPSDWTGIMYSEFEGTKGHRGKIKLHHCSSQNRTWEFYEHGVEGDVEASSSIYRSGGASDGTPISWKMVSSANVDELGNPCNSPQITLPNSTVSSRTVTIHGIIDSATNLQDDEVWMEVSYPADASSGLGTFKTTHKLAPYEAASDLATSTETWIGTGGFSNLNKFKLASTFTPGKAGPISARVCIGKASTTIYICPKMEIA